MKSFKPLRAFLAGALLFLSFSSGAALADTQKRQAAWVDQAVTGEIVRLKGGKELRYIGLESYSPESKNALTKQYGVAAQTFNQELVGGKKVWVEWGPKLRDKQGRLMGYVFTEDGRFVNELLARAGHAKVRMLVPNTHYADKLEDAEWAARKEKKGLWEKEPDVSAAKRLVGEKNSKIYYLPDSPELERIPEAQLVYFNSRVDAKAAGYKACFSCKQKGELDENY